MTARPSAFSQSDLERLVADPARVADVGVDGIPALLCQLRALQTALAARLVASASPREPAEPAEADRLLTVEEAAPILGVTPRWLYGHQRLPFVRKLSRKALRVSEAGLRRWLAVKRT